MNDSEAYKRANSAALRFLSYRARSEAEVRTRLLQRYPSELVNQVLATLTRQGLINDSEFAYLWKQSRDSHRPRSAFLIQRELRAKGVSPDLAAQAVADLDEADAAYRAGQKYVRRLRDLDFQNFSTKLWAHLGRRGFNSSTSRNVVTRLWTESEQQIDSSLSTESTELPFFDSSGVSERD
jgi:regulatory protein